MGGQHTKLCRKVIFRDFRVLSSKWTCDLSFMEIHYNDIGDLIPINDPHSQNVELSKLKKKNFFFFILLMFLVFGRTQSWWYSSHGFESLVKLLAFLSPSIEFIIGFVVNPNDFDHMTDYWRIILQFHLSMSSKRTTDCILASFGR